MKNRGRRLTPIANRLILLDLYSAPAGNVDPSDGDGFGGPTLRLEDLGLQQKTTAPLSGLHNCEVVCKIRILKASGVANRHMS